MTLLYIIGILALLLTTVAFIPQVYKTVRSRSTADLSFVSFCLFFLGSLLWFLYGLYIHDTPVMLQNGITTIAAGIIFCYKIIGLRKRKN